jgi:pilus assembly protein Flp/PilA
MLKERAKAFVADESGATAIEYGMIAAGIFLAIIPPVVTLSDNLETTYTQILSYFDNVNN